LKGYLCRKAGSTRTSRALRPVVPRSLVRMVLRCHHGIPIAGHKGMNATKRLVERRWWWETSSSDVERYVTACVPCNRRKFPRPGRAGMARDISASRPHARLCMDIWELGVVSAAGNDKILAILDSFTRWLILIPLAKKDSKTIANAILKHLISNHGIPVEILTDREAGFVSAGITKMCKTIGIRKIHTSGMSSQANGAVERVFRTLAQQMTIYTGRHPSDWEDWVDALVFAHRASVCSSTGYSPFFMTYGRDPLLPLEAVWGADNLKFRHPKRWVKHMTNVLQETFRKARDAQLRVTGRNKARRDRNRYQVGFEPLDKVFYWEQEYVADKTVYKPKKLRWLYSGPHTILKRLGDLQYEVEHCDRRPGKNKFTTGVNRLRPWKWSEYYDNDEDWVQWMVGEMDPPRAHLRGEGRPAVDDMVVIAVEQPDERVDDNGEPHMPF
jgi:transposase InsO family protein